MSSDLRQPLDGKVVESSASGSTTAGHISDTGTKVPSRKDVAAELGLACFTHGERLTTAIDNAYQIIDPLYTRIEELEAENARLKNTDD